MVLEAAQEDMFILLQLPLPLEQITPLLLVLVALAQQQRQQEAQMEQILRPWVCLRLSVVAGAWGVAGLLRPHLGLLEGLAVALEGLALLVLEHLDKETLAVKVLAHTVVDAVAVAVMRLEDLRQVATLELSVEMELFIPYLGLQLTMLAAVVEELMGHLHLLLVAAQEDLVAVVMEAQETQMRLLPRQTQVAVAVVLVAFLEAVALLIMMVEQAALVLSY